MNINLTSAQAIKLFLALKTSGEVQLTQESNATSGHFHQHDVDIDYHYDGSKVLTLNVTAKNTFIARHAPESTVEGHINELVQKFINS